MVQCGICLEDYQEGDLELHQEMCLVRLMFRCSLCNEDYVSKEGLWNHLDLHEIVDESKELHYQEIKAKHKLHQCVLCNDQRAYSEIPYWKHIHDVHDGFFLRCSDCGKNFRSKQLKNDHVSSRCETVSLEEEALQKESASIEVENDAEHVMSVEQSSNANEKLDNRLLIDVNLNTAANDVDNNIIDKEPKLPTVNLSKSRDLLSRFVCDNCGITFSSKRLLLRHNKSKHSCLEGRQQKCPHCRRKFQMNEYQAHLTSCEKKQFSCKLCPLKFQASAYHATHMRNVHRRKGVLKGEKRDHNQAKNRLETAVNCTGKTLVSSSDSSCSSNVVEDRDISMAKMDIADRSAQLVVESQSSTSSGTKCVHCGKDCATANNLHRHFTQFHRLTKCSICETTFEGASNFRYHKIVKHTKRKYECAKCSKKFHFIDQYKRHSNGCDPVQCATGTGELILRDRSDPKVEPKNPSSEPSYTKCSQCGIEVPSAVTLAHHMLIHHAAASYTKCSYCGMEECNAVTLVRHILKHHDPVACDFCGTTLSSLSKAKHHMKTVHKESTLKCPHCSMLFSCDLQKHVSKCENEKLPCDFCGKMFKNVTRVFEHKKRSCRAYKTSKEQKQKNAESSLCDESESSTAMEKNSLPLVESGLFQTTKCYYCYDEFSSPGFLNHHLKIWHKLTKCDICGITVIGISATSEHKVCCTQGQSTVNPSAKVDTSTSQSNEHSLANLADDELLDSQGIDEESPMVSVAPLDSSLEKQVVSEKTSQSRDENLSNHPHSCDICGITLHRRSHIRYHMQTRHKEGKFQCPHCAKKFPHKSRLERHVSCCTDLRHSCEFCGRKFKLPSRLENHKNTVHHGCRPLRNTSIEGANFIEKQMKHSGEKQDADREMISCIICRITFVSTDELIKHKLTCLKHAKEHDDSKFGAEKISLLQEVKETQTYSSNIAQSENIELELEIKVEETMLQEQEDHVPNEDPGSSSTTTMIVEHTKPKYECAKCLKEFHNIDQYKRHSNGCDPVQCATGTGELILKDRSDPKVEPMNPSSEPSHTKCSHCEIEVSSAVTLARHMFIHHAAASYTKCSYCGMEERNAVTLARHILMHHDPVACDFCGTTLSSLSKAKHHMRTVHKESTLKCPHCSMLFSCEVRLQKHVSKCENEKLPCDFCGKMFKNVTRVTEHKKRSCSAYKTSKEQKQKNAETSLCDETESCTAMEKNSLPLTESGLSQTKCFYCNKEFSSPGFLNHHLKICHELTKCDICGITVIGISATNEHKIICHLEPNHECPTCGRKFHCRKEFSAHYLVCEHKRYLCKLCGHTMKTSQTAKWHLKKSHPEVSNFEIIQVAQDRKQVPNNDQQMEISEEETTLSARDDQGQSTVNPSFKVDTSNPQSNEHSLANLTDDDLLDSQAIDKESPKVSEAPLDSSLEKQVVSEKTSQSCDENLSNHPYSCNICGITLHRHSQIRYHMQTKHKEGKFQCPHCAKKFHYKSRLECHVSCCADLRHSCEFCGRKFNLQSRLENHKNTVHHGCRPLRNTSIEGADREMISCIICRITFVSTDELMKHKLTCLKHAKEHDDSQFGAEKIFLLHGVKETQTYFSNIAHSENIELELEIKVEETMLQEQEDQVPNEDPGSSSTTTMHPHGTKSKDDEAEDAEYLVNGIKVKEERLEDVEEMLTEYHTYRNESLISQEAGGQSCSCSICGLAFGSKSKMKYHMLVGHTKPQYKCPRCETMFHLANILRRHEKRCLDVICNKCGVQFASRQLLNSHKKHPHGAKSKDNEADDAKDLENGVKVKEENLEDEVEILTEHQSSTESGGDQSCPCLTCGLAFGSIRKMRYHMLVCHTEPRFKCARCQKLFHLGSMLRSHEKSCSELICNKCGVKFTSRYQLKGHKKHVHDG